MTSEEEIRIESERCICEILYGITLLKLEIEPNKQGYIKSLIRPTFNQN